MRSTSRRADNQRIKSDRSDKIVPEKILIFRPGPMRFSQQLLSQPKGDKSYEIYNISYEIREIF